MKRVSSNLYILQSFNKLQRLYHPFLAIIPTSPSLMGNGASTENIPLHIFP